MKKILFFIILALPFFRAVQAQPESSAAPVKARLHLLAKSYGDSIVLRWAVQDYGAWRYANSRGFILERLTMNDANNAVVENFRPLTASPIRPWTEAEWQQRLDRQDSFAVIAAQCLLGESKVTTESGNFFKALDNKAKEDANRFSFAMLAADLSPQAADGLGLRFVDRKVEQDKKYVYRLRVEGASAKYETDTALFILATKHSFPLNPPPVPEVVAGDSTVTLTWLNLGFTAWHVERSENGGTNWRRITKRPFLMSYEEGAQREKNAFTDFTKDNYVGRLYRIRGITPFGELSPPSEPVEGHGIDQTPPFPPVITFAENTKGIIVELRWDVAPAADLKGFLVAKSNEAAGPYEPMMEDLLPVNVRSFTDRNADEFARNYYRVYSLDEHGNPAASMPAYVVMRNQAPPARPFGLVGNIDTAGVVTLQWLKGRERDLWGYQVFFANQADHEFHNLSKEVLTDTVFFDTISLKSLTEKIYYRVKAVDLNYAVSEFSEVLELKKPDFIPPVPPVFTDYLVTDTSIFLQWAPTSSEDAVKQILYRKAENNDWRKISDLTLAQTIFTDKNVVKQVTYSYTLTAMDDDGLESEKSFPVTLRVYDTGLRPAISLLKAMWDEEAKTIRLSWQYNEQGNYRFVLYRQAGDELLRKYGTLESSGRDFEDNKVAKNRTYRYFIKVEFKDGGKSLPSEEVLVSID